MKINFILATAILATMPALADVVITQKIESSMLNGDLVMKIKGDKGRVDMPGGPAGAMSIIIDTKGGGMTTVIHSQKMAMKVPAEMLKAKLEEAKKIAGVADQAEKPKSTGTKEKVGEWDTEVFEIKQSGVTGKVWVTTAIPNGDKIKAEMAKLSSAMSQGQFDANKLDVPGIPVKTEVTIPVAGKMTTTVTKISDAEVKDTEFDIPSDYKTMDVPGK